MKNIKSYKYLAAIAGLLFMLSACTEGPAEEAGEKLDDASTDVQNSLEDACEGVKDTLNADDKDC